VKAIRRLRDELVHNMVNATVSRIQTLSGWHDLPGDGDDKTWAWHDRQTIKDVTRTLYEHAGGYLEELGLPVGLEFLYV